MSGAGLPKEDEHDAAAHSSAQTRIFSRADIRFLLRNIFRIDADLKAFLIDRFPDVAERLSDGMDRVSHVNLLLTSHNLEQIVASLRQFYPQEFAEQAELLPKATASANEQRAERIGQAIRELQSRRATHLRAQIDTREIDQELARLKREQRQGPQLHETDELSERYCLLQRLGKGSFGTVWQAYDRTTDVLVAAKILHSDKVSTENLARFYSGALQMKRLSSHHIVRVESEPTEDRGFHYFIMEYLPGGDLHQSVKRGMSSARGLQAILEVGQALAYMHRCNLVHRDVKPANILLDGAGQAKLTDFDLVRTDLDSQGTRTSTPLGSLLYASPEALTDGAHVDTRTDIYSLAKTTLYFLHKKELPMSSIHDCTGLINKLSCADTIKEVLRKALETDPSKRHGTVTEFCTDLSLAWRNESISASSSRSVSASSLNSAERLLPAELAVARVEGLLEDIEFRAKEYRRKSASTPVPVSQSQPSGSRPATGQPPRPSTASLSTPIAPRTQLTSVMSGPIQRPNMMPAHAPASPIPDPRLIEQQQRSELVNAPTAHRQGFSWGWLMLIALCLLGILIGRAYTSGLLVEWVEKILGINVPASPHPRPDDAGSWAATDKKQTDKLASSGTLQPPLSDGSVVPDATAQDRAEWQQGAEAEHERRTKPNRKLKKADEGGPWKGLLLPPPPPADPE